MTADAMKAIDLFVLLAGRRAGLMQAGFAVTGAGLRPQRIYYGAARGLLDSWAAKAIGLGWTDLDLLGLTHSSRRSLGSTRAQSGARRPCVLLRFSRIASSSRRRMVRRRGSTGNRICGPESYLGRSPDERAQFSEQRHLGACTTDVRTIQNGCEGPPAGCPMRHARAGQSRRGRDARIRGARRLGRQPEPWAPAKTTQRGACSIGRGPMEASRFSLSAAPRERRENYSTQEEKP
jgi:hypothetical protein